MFYSESMSMPLPLACLTDLTPPTFSGISGLVPQANGSLRAQWATATDLSLPITYDIYIATGTVLPAALFVASNITMSWRPDGTGPFFRDIYSIPDGTYLTIDGVYTLGIRARDAVGNENTNLAVLTATSHGVLPDCLTQTAADLNLAINNVQSILNSIAAAGGVDMEIESPKLDMEVEC